MLLLGSIFIIQRLSGLPSLSQRHPADKKKGFTGRALAKKKKQVCAALRISYRKKEKNNITDEGFAICGRSHKAQMY